MRRTIITCDKCGTEIKLGDEKVIKYCLTNYHYCKKCFKKIKEYLEFEKVEKNVQ